jgi:hypothetical protein
MTNKKDTTQVRQGDVLLTKLARRPSNLGKEVPLTGLGPVLALGEATGHHHTAVAYPEAYDPAELPDASPLVEGDDYTVRSWAATLLQEAIDRTAPAPTGPACRLYEKDGNATLEVERNTILRHEEHAAVLLTPGYYQVSRQRELVEGDIRRVQD